MLETQNRNGQNVCLIGKCSQIHQNNSFSLLNSKGQVLVDCLEGTLPPNLKEGDIVEVNGLIELGQATKIIANNSYLHPK